MAAVRKARRNTAIVATCCYFITIPFLILVAVGNTHIGPILSQIYFFKLDVAHIIPISVENSFLLNSVAQSLGLHDFYQVGLFNFCEGYDGQGVTDCSKPEQFYWFNPVEVLVSELLSGAQIALPSTAITILKLLRLGSRIMYGFFIAGSVVNAVLVFVSPLAIRTRWWSLGLSLLGLAAAILVTVAAVIATVISVAFKIALTAQDQLNIQVDIGVRMFAFMWIAAILTDLAFVLHAAMGCCCKPSKRSRAAAQGDTQSQTQQEMQEAPETPRGSDEEKTSSSPKGLMPKMMRRRKGPGSFNTNVATPPLTETT